MMFSYDKFKNLDKPHVYIGSSSKVEFGTIHAKELVTDLFFNDINTASFKVYKNEDSNNTKWFSDIVELNTIHIDYIGWFKITDTKNVIGLEDIYKEVTCKSLEYELCGKNLTSFGSLGTEDDEQGGLDRYYLNNLADTTHSIMHIVKNKCPNWNIGYIDPDISTGNRSFNNDSVSVYAFLTGDVSKAFDCIFQFNTFTNTISAYKLENIGEITSIYLSHENLIKEISQTSSLDDIKTVMHVIGGNDDTTGTPLTIAAVNPSGTNYIYNFSAFKHMMSAELRDKLTLYETEYASRLNNYDGAVADLNTLYGELENIKSHAPSTEHSTTWSEYGLVQLQAEKDYYEQQMSLYYNGSNETRRIELYNIINGTNGVVANIAIRQAEYDTKQTEINSKIAFKDSLTLNLREYLGETLYTELSAYVYETEYIGENFVAYNSMTDKEIQDMQRELLESAQLELGKVSKPSWDMSVNAINFTKIQEFIKYSEQLELGNIITLCLDDDTLIEARLLKLHYNWNNSEDFELTFSSKNSLEDKWAQLGEIQAMANNAVTTQQINGGGWNSAKKESVKFSQYRKSALDCSLQKIFNNDKQEVINDEIGSLYRRWLDAENKYSDDQMRLTSDGLFLTRDNWRTLATAIGDVVIDGVSGGYGINADILLGKLLLGETLKIINDDNTFIVDGEGLSFTNGTNTFKLNKSQTESFLEILKDQDKVIYIDENGNANFTGNINASTIIGGKVVSSNWYNQNGELSGVGTYIDLNSGELISQGKSKYDWLDKPSIENNVSVEIKDGLLKCYNDTTQRQLHFLAEGISTRPGATGATGTIDFYSQLFGDGYYGMSLITQGSPIGFRSGGSSIILDPRHNFNTSVFDFDTQANTEYGRLRFGERIISEDALGNTTKTLDLGLLFDNTFGSKGIYCTDGDGAKSNLVPLYASNIPKGISSASVSKDTNGRISSLNCTFTNGSTGLISVGYDTNGNITSVGDTTLSY